jgi:hypothetical protein
VNGENSSDFRVIDNFRCRENLKNQIEGKFNTDLGSKERSVVCTREKSQEIIMLLQKF